MPLLCSISRYIVSDLEDALLNLRQGLLAVILGLGTFGLASQSYAAESGAGMSSKFKYTGAQSAIGDEEVEGKDPLTATLLAVVPGVLIHGFGNYYAGDYEFGTRMLVAQVLGTSLALLGYNIIHQPENWGPYFGGEVPQAGYWIKAGGMVLLVLSWVGDLATASDAAESYNKEHSYQFQLDSYNDSGARLMLSSRF